MQQPIQYVWTDLDANILAASRQGESWDEKTQGKYVTPFGISPKWFTDTPAAGASTTVDLAWSVEGGECWRATRFHVEGSWVPKGAIHVADWTWENMDNPGERDAKLAAYHAYEWIPFDVPPGIATLGKLCAHLASLGDQFPKTLYLNASKTAPLNASTMLFDYWGNSKWRAEMLKDGDVQSKYWNDPDSIPLRVAGNARLEHVLRKKRVLAPVPAAPGGGVLDAVTHKAMAPELQSNIEAYIKSLFDCCATITTLFKLSETVVRDRLSLVHKGSTIKVAAEVSRDCNKQSTDAANIARLLDDVLPKARSFFIEAPVNAKNAFVSTNNARVDIEKHTAALHDLLFATTYVETLDEWRRALVELRAPAVGEATFNGETLNANLDRPLIELDDKLEDAVEMGLAVYGEAAYQAEPGNHDEWMTHEQLRELLDSAPESHAKSAEEVKGNSPVMILLTSGGKHYSSGRKVSKVGIRLIQTWMTWAVLKEGKVALKQGAAAADAFAEGLLSRLPKVILDPAGSDAIKLQDAARDAIRAGSADDAGKLAEKVAKKVEPKLFKTVLKVLDLVAAFAAICAERDGSKPVVVLSYIEDGAKCVEKVIGTFEAIYSHLDGFDDAAAKLTRAGACFGAVAAVANIVKGIVAIVELVDHGGSAAAFTGVGLEIAGGVCALASAVLTVASVASGGAVFALEAVGIIFSILGGAIKGPGAGKYPNDVLLVFVRELRGRSAWQVFENADAESMGQMKQVEESCQGAFFVPAPNTTANWSRMRRAGFDDASIRSLLAMAGMTRPNDAPADWR